MIRRLKPDTDCAAQRSLPGQDPSAELLMLMVDSCACVLLVVNASGVLVRANPACLDMVGRSADTFLGRPVWQALPGMGGLDLARAMWEEALSEPEGGVPQEQIVIDSIGARRRLRWTFARINNDVGRCRYLIATGMDVTRERLSEGVWRQRAESDPLTGLANRAAFTTCLLEHADPVTGLGGGVMFCDLDGFKAINDSFGQLIGDAVLVEVGDRLRRCVREGDVVARFGGDEFAILLPTVSDAGMRALAARVEAAVKRPMGFPAGQIQMGVSIGYSVLIPGHGAEEAMREADQAMYAVKSQRAAQAAELDGSQSEEAL